jgi:hypothetical protein
VTQGSTVLDIEAASANPGSSQVALRATAGERTTNTIRPSVGLSRIVAVILGIPFTAPVAQLIAYGLLVSY